MNHKQIFLLFFILFNALGAKADALVEMDKVATKIVTKLYQTIGNKIFLQPDVKIVNCLESGNCAGARYRKRHNVIELEDELYKVCRNFGKDSLNALAFILGHELGHYYSAHDPEGGLGFNAPNYQKENNTEREHLADIHGIFNAYLAGYDTRKIIPQLLDACLLYTSPSPRDS